MRLDKGAILASMAVIALASVLVGAGTMAYFSDTASSAVPKIQAGTLKFGSVTMYGSTPDNWAPGEQFVISWKLTNGGTLPIAYIGTDFRREDYKIADLSDVIQVVQWEEYVVGPGWFVNLGDPQNYENLVGNGDETLTLKELICSYIIGYDEPKASNPGDWYQDQFGWWVAHTTDGVTGHGYDAGTTAGEDALPVGGEYWVRLTLKFMESAGNEYQGAKLWFSITWTGAQDLSEIP